MDINNHLAMAAVMTATAPLMNTSELLATKKPKQLLKEARGRGNQGDHAPKHNGFHTLPQHVGHNALVEAKRQAKLAARSRRDK